MSRCRAVRRRVEQWANGPSGIAVTYSDELPFDWADLPAHRAEVCDYCFFWGPTRSRPLPEEDWFNTDVRWANTVLDAVGEIPGHGSYAAVGPPDGDTCTFLPGTSATYADFRIQPALHLSTVLNPSVIISGDTDVAAGLRAQAVIGFARCGTAPASGGGFPSSEWVIPGGSNEIDLHWDGSAGAARDPRVVANGAVRGADYAKYFGLSTDPAVAGAIGDDEVIAFLVIDVTEVSAHPESLNVTLRGPGSLADGEVAPAVDAIAFIE
jgi:hypothetical protein